MVHNGPPGDPNYYSDDEPTQYVNYGDPTGRHGGAVEPPLPWYRKPAALVGIGALAVLVIAAAVYGIVTAVSGDSTTPTSTTAPTTTSAGATTTAVAPVPGTSTETATSTPPTTTTDTTTTTTPSTTTTTTTPSVSTSTSTVTETQTETKTVVPGATG